MKLILVRKRTARVGVLHGYTCYLVATKQKMGHLALETNFAPTSDNCVAHRLNHRWKAVGSDVGMSINKDGRGSAMLAKNIQNLLAVASFLAAGVKFAVRKRTGTALTETVVRLGINLLKPADLSDVFTAGMYVFSAFHHNRTDA